MNAERSSRRALRTIRSLERALDRQAHSPQDRASQSVKALTENFEKIKARAGKEGKDGLVVAWQLSLRA